MFNFSNVLKQITSDMVFTTCSEYLGDGIANVISNKFDEYLFDDTTYINNKKKKSKKKNGTYIRNINVVRL